METFQEHINVTVLSQKRMWHYLQYSLILHPRKKQYGNWAASTELSMPMIRSVGMNPYEDPFLMTKTRACIAITALAVDPIFLSDLRDKGIIVKFDPLLRMI